MKKLFYFILLYREEKAELNANSVQIKLCPKFDTLIDKLYKFFS